MFVQTHWCVERQREYVMHPGSSGVDRRRFIKTAAAVGLAGAFAGCGGDGGGNGNGNGNGGGGATVAAGPGGDFVFEPEEVTISTGETVTWEFESANHNVECDPEQSDEAELPDGAEPFASYDGDDRFATIEEGETWEYTFETAGTYTYVCVPHVGSGMVGTVVVE